MLFRLLQFVRQENVRVVNLHYPSLSVATVLIGRWFARRKFRIVLSFHGSDLQSAVASDRIQRLLWRTVVGRCDVVVTCSRSLSADLLQAYPAVGPKVRVIHNGVVIDACERAARTTALPTELEGRQYIISVGTFEEKKGQDVLLESFRSVATIFEEVDLVLVGRSGPTLPAVQRLASQEALRKRVFIYPDTPNAQALAMIAHAVLFVLPSRLEPFGIAILEAGALNTPVIASDVGGIPEIVEDGQTGLLVPPNDPVALKSAIFQSLNDPQTSTTYAHRLKGVVSADFSLDRVIRAYAELLPTSD